MDTQQIDEILGHQTTLIEEIRGYRDDLKTKVPQVTQALQKNEETILAHEANRYLMPVNRNHDFRKIADVPSGGNTYQVPQGMGLNAGGNFFDKFEVELIPVISGSDPATRPIVVGELLDAMGIGADTLHFSTSFNIFRIKNIGTEASYPSYDLFIPDQHVKYGQGASFIRWCKGDGWSWGVNNLTEWTQLVSSWNPGANSGSYIHIDYNSVKLGAELFLALPTVIPGKWPEGKVLGNLYSNLNKIERSL